MSNELRVDKDIYSIIPVPNMFMDTIDRLDSYLIVCVQFLMEDDYDTVVDFSDEERLILEELVKNQNLYEFLLSINTCCIFIKKGICENIDSELLEIRKACDFLAITQFRFDIREYTIGYPGVIDNTTIAFYFDTISKKFSLETYEKHYFNLNPGIGLDVSFSPLSSDKEFYPYLFEHRDDEVYMECRYYISKACRTFYIPSMQTIFSELFACLEGIGMIGCNSFMKFTDENKRIMSVNYSNQNIYNQKLDLYCFYSETLRTLVLHQGHSLLEYMDMKSASRILTDIFYEIITFAINIIKTEITSFNDLQDYFDERLKLFDDHNSLNNTNGLQLFNIDNFEGEEDIFIFPIENINPKSFIEMGTITIFAKGFLENCRENPNNYKNVQNFSTGEFLNAEVLDMNNKNAVVLLRGKCNYKQLKTPNDRWQYIDDICSAIEDMLVPLYVNQEIVINRDNFISAPGIIKGTRSGLIINYMYDDMTKLMGRVYSLYNNTKSPYVFDKNLVDQELIDIVCSGRRNDEVALACRDAVLTLGKAMREDNSTYILMDLFDAVDKVYPVKYNIADKWKWIASFVMSTRSDYDIIHPRMKEIGKIRTQMYHYGKNANDVFDNENELFDFINELKGYLLKCIKAQFETELYSWDELSAHRRTLLEIR